MCSQKIGAYREIIQDLLSTLRPTKEDVNLIKVKVAGLHNLGKIPQNSELIRLLKPNEKDMLQSVLRRKTVRTISGVTIVAVMTKPWPCPQETTCAYCPGGPQYGIPQSYTGREPAAMRGIQNGFDPFVQVQKRLAQLKAIGHEVDKVEIIIMGGTFPAMPTSYQRNFVKGCLEALIDKKAHSLEEAKRLAETSHLRNVGITVETRPDWAKETHVDLMLTMGVTRVELGVQNVYDDIYAVVQRGHIVQDAIEATRILKDSGLKVVYHLMPGLPGSTIERDQACFQRVFGDPNFKPDMIKIYPCLVLKGTKVYDWWKNGHFRPYTTEEVVQLISEVKKTIPPWIRIMRIQRDIPANLIQAGVARSNLRQLVLQSLKEEGIRCRCIRCREVGHRWLKEKILPNPDNIELLITREIASEGEDVFISVEDSVNKVLIGYLRLRIPSSKVHRPEIIPEWTSIIRELHVCGLLVPVGRSYATAWQHKGYGSLLLSEAERISLEDYDSRKVVITSALGTKQYYKRQGYDCEGPYVSKNLC